MTTTASPSTAQLEPSLLPGLNILIQGPTGVGKTHSIGTAADYGLKNGLEVFVLFLESGRESLMGYWTDRQLPIPENLHWHDLEKTGFSFSNLADMARTLNTTTMETLFKMSDPQRSKHNEFERLCRCLADFEDQRTGKKFGPVDSWGPNRMLVIDGLTGLGVTAMSLVIGGKILKDQRDWGVAQDQIERLVRQLCDGCKCHFTLLSHVERETDPVFGGVKVTVSTLGKALAPKMPPMFSDVVMAKKVPSGNSVDWVWSTADTQADLKTRNLPIADKIPQNFSQLLDKWQSRGGRFSSTVKKA